MLLAAVLRALIHSSSYSCQLFLSFCLAGRGKLFQSFITIVLSSVCMRPRMSLHTSLPAAADVLCCMATLWRPFLSLLKPLRLWLVQLVLSLKPLTSLPYENSQFRWAMSTTCCSTSCNRQSYCSTVAPMLTDADAKARVSF